MDEDALAAEVRRRLRRINESAGALARALGLPPEAKHEIIARMAAGDRAVPAASSNPAAEAAGGVQGFLTTRIFQWVASGTQFVQQYREFAANVLHPPGFTLVPANFGADDHPDDDVPIGTISPVEIRLTDPDPSAQTVALTLRLLSTHATGSVTIAIYPANLASPSPDALWNDDADDDADAFARDDEPSHVVVLPDASGNTEAVVILTRSDYGAGEIEVRESAP